MQSRNVMEDIVKKYLDEMLSMRFDICTCGTCRQDIIAYALSRLPPQYVGNEAEGINIIIENLRVEQSAQVLKELVAAIKMIGEKPRHEESQDRQQAYQLLMKQIKLDRGADFSHYRDRVLKRRIALRMRACNVKTYFDYLQVLIHTPEEYEQLFEVLTINVSSFFRDKPVWDKLRSTILPGIIESKKKHELGLRKIRIWSAGCSHGEEPYSMAILLYELMEQEEEKIRIEIFASDIDKDCLKKARAGRYDKESIKGVNPYYLRRFFIPIGEEFQVVPHVKELVQFKELNLIHDPGIQGVDLVICRNVFIYFNRSLQEFLIMKFYQSLLRDGYFVMGNSENLMGEARHVFNVIDGMLRIYQKIKIQR